MPKQACAISERPAPTSPAMPTISRDRNEKETLAKTPSSARILDAEDLLALGAQHPLGEERLERSADHHLHEFGARHLRHRAGGDVGAVAQHRDAVGDEIQLLEPVGD